MKVVWIIALIALGLHLVAFILKKVYQHQRKQYVVEMDAKIATIMNHIQDVEHQIEVYEIELIGLPVEYVSKSMADYQKLKDRLKDLRGQLLDLQDSVHQG